MSNNLDEHSINQKIKALEHEIKLLKTELDAKKKYVQVPKEIEHFFSNTSKKVNDYFKELNFNPEKGSIEIDDERYILIRASALSNEFFKNIKELYQNNDEADSFEIASSFLFDIGHLIGKQDASIFHQKLNLINPIEKLSAGPLHFAHTGWAFVEILPESNPVANENFYLKYRHPYSFEANSWIKSNEIPKETICSMNAGYSSGWCEESFGIPLTAVEITCKAKGDDSCTFVMAHPEKIDSLIEKEVINQKLEYKPKVNQFFERKKTEEALQKNEAFLKNAQIISKLGSWEWDVETHELIWSEELYKIYELNPKEINKDFLFKAYLNCLNNETIEELYALIDKAINLSESYSITHRIYLKNEKQKWILGSGVPIKNKEGKVTKILGYAQDITERYTTEIELNKFFLLSNDLLCLANFEGYFLKLSKGWEKTLGYTNKELCEKPFLTNVHKEDVEKTINEYKNLKDGEFSIGFENRYRCKDGSYKILRWNASPDKYTGLIYCIVRDVTDEKIAENNLKSALKDKEILLKEVHHRVKNNLQIISSLLNLQSSFIKEKNQITLLNESQNRIRSIASIHELLYQSNEFGTIHFDQYLSKLTSDLIYSYYGLKSVITFEIDAKVKFNIDTSIPLGLLINEIISNSLKHGLKNEKGDAIKIEIKSLKNKQFELLISDNGSGFDYESAFQKSASLGLILIEDLSQQLNGKIIYLNSFKGTNYQLIFSEN